MPQENATATIKPPTTAAPRREKRLVPTAPMSKRRPAIAVAVPRQRVSTELPRQLSVVESKVVASQDPAEMLKVIHTAAALRRAQRLSGMGDSQRQTIRLLSVCMLFALLAAAIGAMWYLQTSLQGSRRMHRQSSPATSVSPPSP